MTYDINGSIPNYDAWKLASGAEEDAKLIGTCVHCGDDITEGSDYWGVANGEFIACTVGCATQAEYRFEAEDEEQDEY